MKFIYVFSEKDKDFLIEKGYEEFKSSADKRVWIFKNKESLNFDFHDIQYVLTDIVTL